jgi:SpoVK/Ycf46/Vps4 family AAA+-type ATPase
VYAAEEKFNDLGGRDQAKTLFGSLLAGKRKPGAVIFIDEIEKAMAGSGDTSGVSQSLLGYLLSYMQDQNTVGTIFVGPPGAAKSAMAKAIGNEGEIPTVTLDLGGIKGSLVGESEGKMRKALDVVTAISGGRPFFVATCNAISILPPELRRRFTVGTMFFDLPTESDRKLIWDIYVKKFGLDEQTLPQADGWTGAEIKQCCDMADRLGVSLIDAAKFVVPVAVSAREKIETLRKEASGRYLDAADDGIYTYAVTKKKERKINLD